MHYSTAWPGRLAPNVDPGMYGGASPDPHLGGVYCFYRPQRLLMSQWEPCKDACQSVFSVSWG